MWHFILTTRQAVRISDHFDKANLWDQPYAQRLSPLQTMGKVCHSNHSAKLGITIEIAHIHPLYMTMVQLPSDYVDDAFKRQITSNPIWWEGHQACSSTCVCPSPHPPRRTENKHDHSNKPTLHLYGSQQLIHFKDNRRNMGFNYTADIMNGSHPQGSTTSVQELQCQ